MFSASNASSSGGANVRDELRGIDPRTVRAAIERSLTGANESARVGAIRLLADLEVYRPGADGCERCRERKLSVEQARDQFARLIVDAAGRPTDALLDGLERLAWSVAAETTGRYHEHTVEQARGSLRELEAAGVIFLGEKARMMLAEHRGEDRDVESVDGP